MNEVGHYSEEQLSELPQKRGFRQRGMEMTRLETFADAAFAFAVTLLVVGGGDSVPSSFAELKHALLQVPAFAACFVNIMLFWYAHHIWSRRFGLEDTRSVLLSLLLIFVVLIYVYPLKATFSGAIAFFSGGYFESYFALQTLDDLRTLFVVFGSGYVLLSAIIALLNRHALVIAEQLGLNALEVFDTHTEKNFWWINAAVAVVSIVLAVTLPDAVIFLAGVFYSVFGIILPWYRIRREKRRLAIA
ncbi:MAG: TMEM175 family protein [Woeseiaceae bacterium]